MNISTKLLAAGALALAVAGAGPARAADAPLQINSQALTNAQDLSNGSDQASEAPVTSDNQVWYRVQPLSHDPFGTAPGNPSKALNTVKSMVHFEHSDTGGLVWNSLTVTGLFSNVNDPSSSGHGALEVYSTYRGDISATGFGRPPISFPGVADLQFEFGGDLNYKDNDFGPRRKFLLVGPNFVLDVPGSVTFAVHFAKEFNHNGLINEDVQFHPTWNTELSYTEYFDTNHLVRLEGVFNMTGAKGPEYIPVTGYGEVKTVTEYYTYNSIILDAGQLLGIKPHVLDAFTGVQYWVHKFGFPIKNDGGAFEFTPYFGVGVHF